MPLYKLRNKVQLRKITSLLQRVFPTSRFTAFGHKMSWRVTYIDNHALVANFYITSMSFNDIRENKMLTKFSEFTTFVKVKIQ